MVHYIVHYIDRERGVHVINLSFGMCMVCAWYMHGVHVINLFFGMCMVCAWYMHGVHVINLSFGARCSARSAQQC